MRNKALDTKIPQQTTSQKLASLKQKKKISKSFGEVKQ